MIKLVFKKAEGSRRGLLEHGAVQRGPPEPGTAACPHRKAFPAGTGLPVTPEPRRARSARRGSGGAHPCDQG